MLDVATGGGHVARRLREQGAEVVTADPAPGMQADVALRRRGSAVRRRLVRRRRDAHRAASLHDIGTAVGEMARVANQRASSSRTRSTPPRRSRRPRSCATRRTSATTPRRNGASCSRAPASRSSESRRFAKTHDLEAWLARTECTGEDAVRVRELLAPHTSEDGTTWHDTKLIVESEEVSEVMAIIVDNDTKLVVSGLTGSEGRFHGLRNKAYGTNLVAGVTPGKGGQDVEGVPVFDTVADAVARGGRQHLDDLRARPLRAGRDLRGRRRGDHDRHLHHRAHPRARDAARLHLRPPEGRDADRAELPGCALARQGERRDHPGRGLPARARSGSSRARAR